MFIRKLLPIAVFGMLLSGCGPASNQTGTEVGQALPSPYANAPVTVNIPHRFANWPKITMTRRGRDVEISSTSTEQIRWKGRLVTLYYVPPQNVDNRGNGSFLKSSVGLQKIGTAPISPQGAWKHTWNAPTSLFHVQHVYVLVQTDEGQLGLARL